MLFSLELQNIIILISEEGNGFIIEKIIHKTSNGCCKIGLTRSVTALYLVEPPTIFHISHCKLDDCKGNVLAIDHSCGNLHLSIPYLLLSARLFQSVGLVRVEASNTTHRIFYQYLHTYELKYFTQITSPCQFLNSYPPIAAADETREW